MNDLLLYVHFHELVIENDSVNFTGTFADTTHYQFLELDSFFRSIKLCNLFSIMHSISMHTTMNFHAFSNACRF